MHRRTTIFLIFICFTPLVYLNGGQKTHANEILLDLDEFGNLVPKEDTHLMMPYAEVLFEVTNISEVTTYHVSFNANYTIFNPNETVNTLVGAPFTFLPQEILSEIVITANGSEIEVELMHIEEEDQDHWNQYFSYESSREFLVMNYTFVASTVTIIHYSFEYLLSETDYTSSLGGVLIFYDVGTSRAWNGNITETVEFAVYGQQPDMYGGNLRDPSISEIEGGFRYIWSWENERIEYDTIMIGFPYYTSRVSGYDPIMIVLTLTLLTMSKLFSIKKSKK